LANNGKFLALGGFEEVIKMFNIKKFVEVGELVDHKGTITGLDFFKNEYLISCSEDGDIFLWRLKDFTLIHRLKQKKSSPVIAMATHPSGKLMLAIYKTSHMILWDLTKGKEKLKRKCRSDTIGIKWDKTGTHYITLCEKSIGIYGLADDKPVSIFMIKHRNLSTLKKKSSIWTSFQRTLCRQLSRTTMKAIAVSKK